MPRRVISACHVPSRIPASAPNCERSFRRRHGNLNGTTPQIAYLTGCRLDVVVAIHHEWFEQLQQRFIGSKKTNCWLRACLLRPEIDVASHGDSLRRSDCASECRKSVSRTDRVAILTATSRICKGGGYSRWCSVPSLLSVLRPSFLSTLTFTPYSDISQLKVECRFWRTDG